MVTRAAILAMLIASAAPAGTPGLAGQPYAIERSLVADLRSADGTPYRLMVAWPEGEPPKGGWPLLVVLDGEDNFAIGVTTARRLARSGRAGIAQGVIVGVESPGLPRRVLDYTPPAGDWAIPVGAPAHGLKTGGGEAFLTFLDSVVLPRIVRQWPIDPARRTLAGHSFGGLLALHALIDRPIGFTRFAAVSASLWYGGDLIGREAAGTSPLDGRRLLLAAGDAEGGPAGGTPTGGAALADRLRARHADVTLLPLPGQTHGSTMMAAMVPAIELAFGKDHP